MRGRQTRRKMLLQKWSAAYILLCVVKQRCVQLYGKACHQMYNIVHCIGELNIHAVIPYNNIHFEGVIIQLVDKPQHMVCLVFRQTDRMIVNVTVKRYNTGIFITINKRPTCSIITCGILYCCGERHCCCKIIYINYYSNMTSFFRFVDKRAIYRWNNLIRTCAGECD